MNNLDAPRDAHEKAHAWIDRRLADEATDEENRLLDEHLAACAACRRSLERSQRALRGLGELAVEIDPGLTSRVQAAIARRAQDLERQQADRRTRILGFAVALLMTIAGSLAVWALTPRVLTPQTWTAGVVVFWMLPSLCAAFALLAPHLPTSPLRKREPAS
jgi:predicted anti-sigma-YlaC factor YlaD